MTMVIRQPITSNGATKLALEYRSKSVKNQIIVPSPLDINNARPYTGLWVSEDGVWNKVTIIGDEDSDWDVGGCVYKIIEAIREDSQPDEIVTILEIRVKEQRDSTQAIFRKQARSREKYKALHKPLQVIPKSIRPNEAAAL